MRIETKHIFPLILIIIDIIAGVIYACHGDYKKLIYWISAAVLNITVTFQGVYYAIFRWICNWDIGNYIFYFCQQN